MKEGMPAANPTLNCSENAASPRPCLGGALGRSCN